MIMSIPLLHALYRGNRNNSNRSHHRLLVSRRRLAQGEHRNGHPDRLRFRRTRNTPAAKLSGSSTNNVNSCKSPHRRSSPLLRGRLAALSKGSRADCEAIKRTSGNATKWPQGAAPIARFRRANFLRILHQLSAPRRKDGI